MKGKSIDTNYNRIAHESKLSHYHLTTDIIVIHRRITSLQGITTLVYTPIYIIILAEMHIDLHQSRRSASAVKTPPSRAIIRVDVGCQRV
jgi:hypothetical protein